MPVQQRYTLVPGMGRESTSGRTGDDGTQRYGQGAYESQEFYDGQVPAPHRLSSYFDPELDPRHQSSATLTSPAHCRSDSVSSFKPLPLVPPGSDMPEMRQTGSYGTSLAYQNIPSQAHWPESDSPPYDPTAAARAKKRKRLIWAGIIAGILALIAIIVGVVVSKVTKGSGCNASGSDSGQSSGATDPHNASKFDKDSRLHQSFWAMAYTPQGAQPPNCATSQVNVTRDIQILSQLTTRLRLYGANCNATAMVLQAIQDTKVDMTIWPAVYVDSNTQAYTTQIDAVQDAIKTYGTDHIEGIIIGNEYILNTATSASTTSSTYLAAAAEITDKIANFNTTIQGMSLSKHLPVGTSDAGSLLSVTLATGIDFYMANVHPWFGSLAIQDAAAWTTGFFQEFDIDVAAQAPNKPDTFIAETGWPTASADPSESNSGAGSPQGDASVANLQTFLDTFVCQANANGTKYFYFEAFDEPWKETYGGVEPFWGLFDSERNLKDVTIPTC